jgi:hypothetical protein
MKFILLIALGIIVSAAIFNDCKAQDSAVIITFLDSTSAARALYDDSDYYLLLNSMEITAKAGVSADNKSIEMMRKECGRLFSDGVRDFNPEEKQALQWIVEAMYPALFISYPKYGSMPWKFIKMADNIEGGLPHTRGEYIVIPENLSQSLVAVRKKTDSHPQIETSVFITFCPMLAHEQFHIFQRFNPLPCDSFYINYWDFMKVDNIVPTPEIKEHMAINPDARDYRWIMKIESDSGLYYIWPQVGFSFDSSANKIMPDDFRIWAIRVVPSPDGFIMATDSDGTPIMQDLAECREYCRKFDFIGRGFNEYDEEITESFPNIYHPIEALASLFEYLISYDLFYPKEMMKSAHRQGLEKKIAPYREWFRTTLK